MTARTCDQTEGDRRKAEALTLLEAQREVYVRRGRRALLEALLRSGTASADDVRAAVELPVGMDPRCLGSVPGRLAFGRIIGPAGFVRSTRPERHASWLQVWQLLDREAAEEWLENNPDLPDPAADDPGAGLQGLLFPLGLHNDTGATAGTAAPGMTFGIAKGCGGAEPT